MSDLDSFRDGARQWLAENAQKFGREARRGLTVEADLALGRRYMAARHDAGYAGINWPTEIGGRGLSAGAARSRT